MPEQEAAPLERWVVRVCPLCGGQVSDESQWHRAACPNLERMFAVREVLVMAAEVTDEMVERAMQVIAATFGACDNHTARAALVAALSHQATPDSAGRHELTEADASRGLLSDQLERMTTHRDELDAEVTRLGEVVVALLPCVPDHFHWDHEGQVVVELTRQQYEAARSAAASIASEGRESESPIVPRDPENGDWTPVPADQASPRSRDQGASNVAEPWRVKRAQDAASNVAPMSASRATEDRP